MAVRWLSSDVRWNFIYYIPSYLIFQLQQANNEEKYPQRSIKYDREVNADVHINKTNNITSQ